MSEIKDDEIHVGEKKIGMGSIISLNVKTLLVIVGVLYGGLSSVATMSYFKLKEEIKKSNKKSKDGLEETQKLVDKKLDKTLQIVREDIKEIIKEQGTIKGDIKVLLEKTRQINTTIESNTIRPDRNHLPSLNNESNYNDTIR